MEKRYFYFQDPHSFAYPLVAKLIIFKDRISSLRVQSKWMEVNDYIYYGEPVTCLIPAKHMEYDFVFSLLSSDNSDNIFGAVNYMLRNWYRRFLAGNTEQFIYSTIENNDPILVFSPQKTSIGKSIVYGNIAMNLR